MRSVRHAPGIALLALLCLSMRASAATAAVVAPSTPAPAPRIELEVDKSFAPQVLDHRGGTVRAVAFLPDGRVLAGGTFSFVDDTPCRFFACFARDGSLDRSFKTTGACDGEVSAMRVLPDGRVLVGGFFRTFGGRRAAGLARLMPDGTLDPSFHVPDEIDGGVATIEIAPDGRIFVGGYFHRFENAEDTSLVRLMPDGTLDPSFHASDAAKGKRFFVRSIAVAHDGGAAAVLLVDDAFYERLASVVPPPAKVTRAIEVQLAKFLPDGSVDSKFRAQRAAAIGPRCIVALPGGDFLVGGAGGAQRIGADGLIDGRFHFAENGRMQVEALAVLPGGRFVACGTPAGETLLSARLLVLGPDGAVEARLVSPRDERQSFFSAATDATGHVLAAGQLMQTPGRVEFSKTTNRILRLDRALETDGEFHAAVGDAGRITAMAVHPDGSLTIGGLFLSVDGRSRVGLAHVQRDGALDHGFDPGMGLNAAPRVIVPTADGGVVAAGLLDTFDGRSAKSVVRIHANGTVDWDFAPDLPFRGVFTDSAILSDGTFILVGQLTGRTADAAFSHIVRLDPSGKIDRGLANAVPSWLAPGAGSILTAAPTDTGHVLVGGEFSVMQGRPRNAIARIGGEGFVDPAFVPETDGFLSITKITVLPDQKIFIEGWSQSAGETTARRAFARLLPNGRRDPSFENPDFGAAVPLMAAALADGSAVVAVQDAAPDASSLRRLVRLDRDGSLVKDFSIELGNSPDALQLLSTGGGTVYLFGAVPSIAGQPRFGLARLTPK